MNPVHSLIELTLPRLIVLLLALGRVGGLFLIAPVLGSPTIPPRARVATALFITLAMLPVLPTNVDTAGVLTRSGLALVGAIGRETAIGVIIGFSAQLVVAGVQMAGQIIGIQMGIGLSNLIDPQSGAQVTPIAHWQNLLTLLIFLSIDGHHMLIRAVAGSFGVVPIDGGFPSNEAIPAFLSMSGQIFRLALAVAAPVLLILLLVNGAMAVLAKLIPQLNVFVVGFPLNVAVGMFVLMAAQPLVIQLLERAFGGIGPSLLPLLRSFAGSGSS